MATLAAWPARLGVTVVVGVCALGAVAAPALAQDQEPGPNNPSRRGSIRIQQLVTSGSPTTESFHFDGAITADLTPGGLSTRESVAAGSYSVTQALTQAQIDAGWTLASISCDDAGDGPGDRSHSTGSTVTFEVQRNEDVLCTFSNALAPPAVDSSIQVAKIVEGTGSLAGAFDFNGAIDVDLVGGSSSSPVVVVPGTYTVTELLSPSQAELGWSLRSIQCASDMAGDVSGGDVDTATATFDVQEGENVVCTFTNRVTPNVKSPIQPEVAGRVRRAPDRRQVEPRAPLPFTGAPLLPFGAAGLAAIFLGAGMWRAAGGLSRRR